MNDAVSPEAYQVVVPDRVGPPGPIVPCLDEGLECETCDDQCGSGSEPDNRIWDVIVGLDSRGTALLVTMLPNSLLGIAGVAGTDI